MRADETTPGKRIVNKEGDDYASFWGEMGGGGQELASVLGRDS